MHDYLARVEHLLRDQLDAGDTDAALRLGAILDAADTQPEPPTLKDAALTYASQGIAVFPLEPRAKTPFPGSRGFKDATTDTDQITTWWDAAPDANIGAPTGHTFDVIDIDGPAGVASWSRMVETGQMPPLIGHVSTPRDGGNHLFITPRGHGNKAGLLPGVDYRGVGGYVVLPPSITDDHGLGRTYRWHRPLEGGSR